MDILLTWIVGLVIITLFTLVLRRFLFDKVTGMQKAVASVAVAYLAALPVAAATAGNDWGAGLLHYALPAAVVFLVFSGLDRRSPG